MSNARFGLRVRNGLVKLITEGFAPLDTDALAFIIAAGITDPTQQYAVNKLVIDLKTYGIWTKMKAIYPFVGGTASTHKWNLKDPRDLDAAFRLVFNGGITHASTGVISNGTNGFYNTHFKPASNGSLNDQSYGIYVRTDLNGGIASLDFGTEFALGALAQIYTKVDIGGVQQYATRLNDSTISGVANTDSRGFYAISRIASANYFRQKNNSVATISIASTALPNADILGFKNSTTYTAREQAFAYISEGLTISQLEDIYNIIQAFQTTLGRQV